ncbi:response regulator [Solemya velum gill symbiont]|uniref:response regulator n=1 Tax=Solemya velum gill symbiont TaxID=2340 RepID=UPI000995F125|nr:response regulator [Solemya velum gill symbiont]OOZ43268.1 response regulator [Solemya velum gill symbiont]OOZ44152.1 response regulator [Solemya velum gill symbiont]OOZ47898.1 response regulator [Solemya velum gill symbiont]OOZ49286.1 response regulator [Solemya velum gill symbiont]OOZ53055.1 response regulator [Solemya velum gill symbiont]
MTTIAIVEDNASNMKLIKGVLERAGYQILTMEDADSGIPIIREHLPDLVLMDIHMPGTDGLEATRLLKADSKTRHIPVIAVTARAMEGDREAILAAGCDGYTAKPIRYKEILDMIEQILHGEQDIE